jgi:hypothetical protein
MRLFGRLVTATILLILCCPILASIEDQASQRVGFLAVTVSLGDGHMPLTSAFVFVRGYRPMYKGDSSTVLTQTKDGYFETSLAPGIYDVFVSDAEAIPTCKRVTIVAGRVEHYGVNFTPDLEHLEK